jgi:hypothetical protein
MVGIEPTNLTYFKGRWLCQRRLHPIGCQGRVQTYKLLFQRQVTLSIRLLGNDWLGWWESFAKRLQRRYPRSRRYQRRALPLSHTPKGWSERNRTSNYLINSQAFCPLNYTPIEGLMKTQSPESVSIRRPPVLQTGATTTELPGENKLETSGAMFLTTRTEGLEPSVFSFAS